MASKSVERGLYKVHECDRQTTGRHTTLRKKCAGIGGIRLHLWSIGYMYVTCDAGAMGVKHSSVADDVKRQAESKKPMYNFVDLSGGGELIELMKQAIRDKNYEEVSFRGVQCVNFDYETEHGFAVDASALCENVAILLAVGALRLILDKGINRHTARRNSPVSLVSQCKLVSGRQGAQETEVIAAIQAL